MVTDDLPPGARRVTRAPGAEESYVVLDRVDAVAEADTAYCIHGRTRCVRCTAWCWLGDRTHDLVASGQAGPLCHPCARTVAATGPFGLPPPTAHLIDHLRKDGPH